MMRSYNLRKVTRARLVEHRCLFQAMRTRQRTQIGHVGTVGLEIENDEVIKPQEGDQGQVGGQQVPLLGHGNEINSPNEVISHQDACEPWGYVAPIVAAVVTRATGVRHIYLILTSWRKECGASFFIVLNSIGFSIFGSQLFFQICKMQDSLQMGGRLAYGLPSQ